MNKINLDIRPVFRMLSINGKDIKIPRLGLKHHAILKDPNDHEDAMKKLMASIHPNLSAAERDLVSLHLLAYNERLKHSVVIDGNTYTVDDVIINQKLRFNIGETEFKFKTPKLENLNATIPELLRSSCVSVKDGNGNPQEIPDFLQMPAYTYKWADDICSTIELRTSIGSVKGLYKLMELFDGAA